MPRRYCTGCGADLRPDARFCGSCGKRVHEAVVSPADVGVAPPRRTKRVIKVDRLDKIVGLILAVVVGVPLLLAVLWVVLQFVLGFFAGIFGLSGSSMSI